MPGQIVTANTLTAGIRSDFADAYKSAYNASKERLSNVMDMGIPSDKLIELYAYFETAPFPRLWKRGDAIPRDAFESVQFNVENRDWAIRVEWHENDREDDQTRSLMQRARDAGANFATLPERVWFQILTGATSTELLPAIPNAPDGAAMFSATDGAGDARFGFVGGNILTGGGIASSAAVRADAFGAMEVMRSFQDTEGQPLWDDSVLDAGFQLVYAVGNDEVFREAFIQSRTLDGSAAVTNIILESGLNLDLWATQRLSGNDWYIFAKGAPYKPVFQQIRRPLREAYSNVDNSDESRATKIEGVQWDSREGYGLMLPYQCVKVNN